MPEKNVLDIQIEKAEKLMQESLGFAVLWLGTSIIFLIVSFLLKKPEMLFGIALQLIASTINIFTYIKDRRNLNKLLSLKYH